MAARWFDAQMMVCRRTTQRLSSVAYIQRLGRHYNRNFLEDNFVEYFAQHIPGMFTRNPTVESHGGEFN